MGQSFLWRYSAILLAMKRQDVFYCSLRDRAVYVGDLKVLPESNVMKVARFVFFMGVASVAILLAVSWYLRGHRAVVDEVEEVVETPAPEPPLHGAQTEELWCLGRVIRNLSDLAAFIRDEPPSQAKPVLRRAEDGGDVPVYISEKDGEAVRFVLDESVWSPATYREFAAGVLPEGDGSIPGVPTPDFAQRLLDPQMAMFLEEDQRISEFLTGHPRSAEGHLQAALLLGAIGLNDHSGAFRDVRELLDRMTVHLVAADRFGIPSEAPARQLADAVRLTLIGRQVDALAAVDALPVEDGKESPWGDWAFLLRLRNTLDWREGHERALAGPSALQHEYFRTLARSIGPMAALQFLDELPGRSDLAWLRIANEVPMTTEEGEEFSKPFVAVELHELKQVAPAFGIEPSDQDWGWIEELVRVPEGATVVAQGGEAPEIRVAGRDLWGGYLERHLMHSISSFYTFLHDRWGHREGARQFKSLIQGAMPDLRYRPFLRRAMARNSDELYLSKEACLTVVRENPGIVTPKLWGLLAGESGDPGLPNFEAWFSPPVPSGTVIDAEERLRVIGNRNGEFAWEALLDQAPNDAGLLSELSRHGAQDAVRRHAGALGEYHVPIMRALADSSRDDPAAYGEIMSRIAEFDPDAFIPMGAYFAEHGMPEKAALYYRMAFDRAGDRLRVADDSLWLVQYYHENGKAEDAEEVARGAAGTYAQGGLKAYAWLLEQTGRDNQALDALRHADNRYEDGRPVNQLAFFLRKLEQEQPIDEERFAQVAAHSFPEGFQKVSVADFSGAPDRGVVVNGGDEGMESLGLRPGHVIVALNGGRTDTCDQFNLIRDASGGSPPQFIVWDGRRYRLLKPRAANPKPNLELADYKAP